MALPVSIGRYHPVAFKETLKLNITRKLNYFRLGGACYRPIERILPIYVHTPGRRSRHVQNSDDYDSRCCSDIRILRLSIVLRRPLRCRDKNKKSISASFFFLSPADG